jgi:hypothetical protein
MSHSDPTLGLLLGFGGGLYTFFRGFKVYREFRIVEDTPQIPLRSVPMGLVNVHGKAVGDGAMPSPVTRSPCYFYKVEIEKWHQEQKSSGWKHVRTDTDGVPFFLEDPSGRLLVDARGAELDLTKSCVHEVPSTNSSSFATDEDLLKYVNQAALNGVNSFIGKMASLRTLQDPDKEKARQGLVAALQHPVGQSGISPAAMNLFAGFVEKRLSVMPALADPQHERARQAMLEALKHPVGSPDFIAHAQGAIAHLPDSDETRQKFTAWTESLKTGNGSNMFLSAASGRYRFTEYCIVPGQEYNIAGCCVENPGAADVRDRNMIVKGVNEPTFLISDKALAIEESGLRKRAFLMVFGGAALTIVCLAFLLAHFGVLF